MSTTTIHPADVANSTWTIDPAHTQVEFEVKHMMFAKVRGRFRTVEGTLTLGEGDKVEGSRVDAVIEAASIDTGQPQRDEHLRSPDFFDTDSFPELSFVSASVRPGKGGKLTVMGDLTMHGVTREVELEVNETGRGIDPWGSRRIGFKGTTTIDRRDFGLTWNQTLETGGILVGNEVRITLEIQAVSPDA
jgi:polyisoprenoid-binding protein YceI